jgi:integrase
MPRELNRITAAALRNAKPGSRLPDGGGLRFEYRPNGARYWRLKYRFGGVEKLLALGVYPEVTLAEARRRRDEARALLRDQLDPAAIRRARKEGTKRDARGAFPLVAAEWLAFKKRGWAPETHKKAEYVVTTYLVPPLRGRSIAELATKDASRIIEAIAERAPNVASKARQHLGGIVEYAIRHGLREDGRLLSLRGTVPRASKGHIPAATRTQDIAALVRAIDTYGSLVTRAALKICMYTALRPGVVAAATWSEIDLEAAEWHIPAARMKTRTDHIVSLPTQAIAVLREMEGLGRRGGYVFPSPAQQKTPHVHRDGLSAALRGMGFQGRHATHGFRGMLRTVGRERLGIDVDVLEAQLAHAKKGDIQKAYDRTTFDDARKVAMQRWADYLDSLVTQSA